MPGSITVAESSGSPSLSRSSLMLLLPDPFQDLIPIKGDGPGSDRERLRELTFMLHAPDRGAGEVHHLGDLVVAE